ncbi:MAG: metal-dependent transcriptional regulator [Acidobacteriota bacterium]
MATSTVEDYLKCILLEQQKNPADRVTTGRIAASLRVAPGTATAMVKTLAQSSLVAYEPYSGVHLTESGRQLATHVLRRHRLVELFLVKILGLDWSEVHDEAEHLEHVVSDRVIERMDHMLGYPSVDPHGDPIPNAEGVVEEPDGVSLLGCSTTQAVRVVRIDDQSPEFLQLVERRGLKPGSRLQVAHRDPAADTVELRLAVGGDLSLGWRAASKIFVLPERDDPGPAAMAP